MKLVKCIPNFIYIIVFLKIRNIISKNRRSKVTDYAALSSHSKIDKTKVLKTNGSLMQVESIAECSLEALCNAFDLHQAILGLENHLFYFF